MKAVLATAALVVAVVSTVSPASAQAMSTDWSNWNKQWDSQEFSARQPNTPAVGAPQRASRALGAYAQNRPVNVQQRHNVALVPSLDGHVHSPSPAFDVYDTENHYISSDPDLFIRNELARVPPERGDD